MNSELTPPSTSTDGEPLNGNYDYVMHFVKYELPPVEGFWSVTMDNADSSHDLYPKHESQGVEQESNWLPAPRGRTQVTLEWRRP